MVLLHGGAPRGAELIAAKWADNRGVQQVVFKPDWARHQKAAPFKRNDAMLEVMPIGVIAFPGSGITENLVDKARSEEHTSELQSLMRISYAVFCLKKKTTQNKTQNIKYQQLTILNNITHTTQKNRTTRR